MIPIDLQRRSTQFMIDDDPTDIELIPRDLVTKSANGGQYQQPQSPRAMQRFKLIPMTSSQKTTVTADGRERIIDYTLLGAWDATVEIGDYWVDAGKRYEVVALSPGHNYETKALIEAHG
jgi:hypothetical protein